MLLPPDLREWLPTDDLAHSAFAAVERFFSSLKREWTGDRLYRTRQAAIADVREYVAVYYNSRRLHSTLDYQARIDYKETLGKVSGIA